MGLSTPTDDDTPQSVGFSSNQINNIEEAVAVCDSLLTESESARNGVTVFPVSSHSHAEAVTYFSSNPYNLGNLPTAMPFPLEADLAVMGCDSTYRKDQLPCKLRSNGSRKEKKRTECINNAFSELRKRIPNVPMDTKLSKIKTLRLATSYIAYLTDIVQNADPSDPRDVRDFRADLKALRTRERRRQLCHADINVEPQVIENGHKVTTNAVDEANNSEDKKKCKTRRKGRTGWPEAVWAMELESKVSQENASSISATKNVDANESISAHTTAQNVPFANVVNDNAYNPEYPQRFYVFNNPGSYTTMQPYNPNVSVIGANGAMHTIGVTNGDYGHKDEHAPPFPYPAMTLPAASSFSRRLPPIPRLLHENERMPEIPDIRHITENQNSEFEIVGNRFTDQEKESLHSTPSFAELKTVSLSSIKISTSAINGYGTFTMTGCTDDNLQCLEATPVFGCITSD